ncbi:MAG: ATP-binding cassette domain-containing protein [Actinomycetales bacterium]|nr:ATP-binding cassette domain-containing protein [Actinomycetales bacterium]
MKIDLRLLLKGSSRYLFLASCAAALIWSALLITNAWLISDLIIRVINSEDIYPHLYYLAALWIFRSCFLAGFENWSLNQAIRAKKEFRSSATTNSFGIRQFSPATMSNLLTKGLNSIDTYYGRFIPQLLFSIFVPTLLILVLLTKDVLSAVVAILTLPVIPFFGALIGRYTNDAVGKKWKTLGTLFGYFEDSLKGYATLKVFGRNRAQTERIEKMGQKYSDETMKVLKISFLSSLALELAATISVAVIAVEIGLRLVGGHMEFSSALMILILAPEIYFPLRNAASLFHASTDGTEALTQLNGIPKENEVSESNSDYPKGLQFWVGPSGAGKTTAALKLINSYDKRGIGWVPQAPRLAQGSIRKQFQLINPGISDMEIAHYLDLVGLSVRDLPSGLDSVLESGNEFLSAASGGQIRKVALARALSRQPKLLIADEPTADLDKESAARVIATLRSLNCGVIVITHDLDLLQSEDKIVRIER